MRYRALASDYDGTLALHGSVDDQTVAALHQFLASGRRLIMITGRELPELMAICPCLELFEWVVAENGGLLYRPSTREKTLLAEPPHPEFVQALRERQVSDLSVGDVIVATWEPHQTAVLEAIRELGLELQVIFNKGAVMVLPTGVNKASGLAAALRVMGLSEHDVIGVGDAENDHAFLKLCEVSVAVSNALPAVKDTADFVATLDHGAGVRQLIERVLEDDLESLTPHVQRHFLSLGTCQDQPVSLAPSGRAILICGPSASGKSTVATRIVESLQDQKYQFCLVDPEGDYADLPGAVAFGGPQTPPPVAEVLRLLEDPRSNAVVGLSGMPIPDRPALFLELMSQVLQLRARTGRPHWIVLDEAHHLLPAEWRAADSSLPREFRNFVLITVHPELLAPEVLERVDTVLALGATAGETLTTFAETVHVASPELPAQELQQGEVLMWQRHSSQPPMIIKVHPCRMERQRHRRKYAVGELPPDRSFYFRGPDGRMNLRAQNLMLFLQLSDGVDDETWEYHLHQGDYSRWFREAIKDENLAEAAARIEQQPAPAGDSRARIRHAVEQGYTLPASPMPVAGAS